MDLQVPVCFCIFNRPDTTAAVFSRIRQAKPPRLLVVADGPRTDRPGEADLVEHARRIATAVDWDCQVETCFSGSNLGCARRMSSGLNWAFERSEQLIILEDDCVPDPTFFGYCQQLLRRFADDRQVMMISGDNFCRRDEWSSSYYFSRWAHIWGWASWRRAWNHYDLAITDWPRIRASRALPDCLEDPHQVRYWNNVLDAVYAGEIDTWDYSWQYALFRAGGLAILPNQNLVSNIGHDARGTHTRDPSSRFSKLPTLPMNTLTHPQSVERHRQADQWTFENLFRPAPVTASEPRRSRWWHRLTGRPNRAA